MKPLNRVLYPLIKRIRSLNERSTEYSFDYAALINELEKEIFKVEEANDVIVAETSLLKKQIASLLQSDRDFSDNFYRISSVVGLDGTIDGHIVLGEPPEDEFMPLEKRDIHRQVVKELNGYNSLLERIITNLSPKQQNSFHIEGSLKYIHLATNPENLKILFERMRGKLIGLETKYLDFKSIFSGQKVKKKVRWIKRPLGYLRYFLEKLEQLELIERMPNNEKICYVDHCFEYRSKKGNIKNVFAQKIPTDTKSLDIIIDEFAKLPTNKAI